jgi:hypothetical protein
MWEKYKTCNVLWKKLGFQIALLMHVQIGENYIFFCRAPNGMKFL